MTTVQTFLTKWRAALRRAQSAPEMAIWEGTRALQCLRKTGMLQTAMFQGDLFDGWRGRYAIRFVRTEIAVYSHYSGRELKEVDARLEDAYELLTSTKRRFQKARRVGHLPFIKRLLAKYEPILDVDIEAVERKQTVALPASLWEPLLREPKYQLRPGRQVDLDTRFQARIGRIFRFFLPTEAGITLTTIGRLTVLVYFTAGLAEIQNDSPTIVQSGRTLTVDSVVRNLRRAGLK